MSVVNITNEQVMSAVEAVLVLCPHVKPDAVAGTLEISPQLAEELLNRLCDDGELVKRSEGDDAHYTLPPKHERFAHLVESVKYGQIVVMKGENDEGDAGIKFIFTMPGTGINEAHIEIDEDQIDNAFESLTDDEFVSLAEGIVGNAWGMFGGMFSDD